MLTKEGKWINASSKFTKNFREAATSQLKKGITDKFLAISVIALIANELDGTNDSLKCELKNSVDRYVAAVRAGDNQTAEWEAITIGDLVNTLTGNGFAAGNTAVRLLR